MPHRHAHVHCCHPKVKFCGHCNVVYCESCSQEWTPKLVWSTTYTCGNQGYQGYQELLKQQVLCQTGVETHGHAHAQPGDHGP